MLPILEQGSEVKMLSFPLCCLTLSMSSGNPWDVTLRMSCTRLYGSVFLFTSLLHRAGGPRLAGAQEDEGLGVLVPTGPGLPHRCYSFPPPCENCGRDNLEGPVACPRKLDPLRAVGELSTSMSASPWAGGVFVVLTEEILSAPGHT